MKAKHTGHAQFSDIEMTNIAEQINLHRSIDIPSFVMGSLNVTSFSDTFEALVKRLGLMKINDLNSFKAELDKGDGGKYHRLGAFCEGINQVQLEYILYDSEQAQYIQKSSIRRNRTAREEAPSKNLKGEKNYLGQSRKQNPILWYNYQKKSKKPS